MISEPLMGEGGSRCADRLNDSHILMENRNGLILDLLVTQATGTAEREAALVMLDRRRLPRKRTAVALNLLRMTNIEAQAAS